MSSEPHSSSAGVADDDPVPPPAAASNAPTLGEQLDLLSRMPALVSTLLAGTSAGWHGVDEGPGTWSAQDVVAHLIYADEEVWLARAVTIRDHGEGRPFPPGDPAGHLTRFGGWSLDRLLERFAASRTTSLSTVRGWNLGDEDLRRRGRHTHYGAVTLGELFATWAAHDLTHLRQIARVMAKRLGSEVGAWRDSLTILQR
jgi:hypothetical protein